MGLAHVLQPSTGFGVGARIAQSVSSPVTQRKQTAGPWCQLRVKAKLLCGDLTDVYSQRRTLPGGGSKVTGCFAPHGHSGTQVLTIFLSGPRFGCRCQLCGSREGGGHRGARA